MATESRVTLRAQWLGRQLRDLREAAYLRLRDVGEYLKRDTSTVSRFETGTLPIRPEEVRSLLDLFGVRDEHRRSALLQLADDAWKTGWWQGYADEIEGSLVDYVWLESRATTIRSFDTGSLFGLLQTGDYARAVMRGADPSTDDAQIGRWTELRLMRQAILQREDPVRLSMIIEETLLHRLVGGAAVLAAQLRYLADHATHDNIDVRILPFTSGAHASMDGSFRIIGLTDPFPEVACVESPAGVIYLERPDVERFVSAYDRLRSASLDAQESIARITQAAAQLERP